MTLRPAVWCSLSRQESNGFRKL